MQKENQIALRPNIGAGTRMNNPFSWGKIQKFYNSIPLGITPCRSVYEAKMYTCVMMIVMAIVFIPFIIPAICLYRSAGKEERL